MDNYITVYENSDFTGAKRILLDDMTHIGYTTGYQEKHEVVIDGTKFYWQDISGNITTMPSEFTDPLVQYNPGGQGVAPIIPNWHDKVFYIKPNMTVTINMYVENGHLIWNYRLRCDNQTVAYTGEYASSTPLPARALRFGLFKSRPTQDGETSVGLFIITGSNETMHTGVIEATWTSENYWDGSFNVTTKSPSKNATVNSRGGTRSTASDVIEPGSAYSSLNVLANGGTGLHVYKLTQSQLMGLYHAMFSKNVLGSSDYKAYGLASGLLAMHYLPVDIAGTARNNIYINGLPLVNLRGSGHDMGGTEIAEQVYATDWFSCQFDSNDFVGNSFLDFSPYVAASLILPFIGTVSLDVNKVMYGEVRVRYIIDILSGNCLAEVYVTDLDGKPLFFNRYPGNCAYTIPIFANESGGYPILGLFEGIASAGLGIAGANEAIHRARKISQRTGFEHWAPPYARENAQLKGAENVGGAIENMANWEMNTAMIGSLPHNVSALAGNYAIAVSLTIKNSLTCLDSADRDMIKAIMGYSAAFWCKLGSLDKTGFVSGELHADNVPKATDAEKAELEALLIEGVYL